MRGTVKIGMAEAVVLLTMANMARIFLTLPRSLVDMAGEAAWLSSLIGLIPALIQVYMFYVLLKPHPGKNIVDITGVSLGKFAGSAANVIYVIFFLGVGAVFTRIFSEALLLSALPRTPISVVTVIYTSASIIGAYYGPEAMARSARVTYPFVVAGIAVLLLSLVPRWDINHFFPILGSGVPEILSGSLIAGAVAEILVAAVIVQTFHGTESFGRITARAMLMGFAYLTLLEMVLILTYFSVAAQEITLPFYQLSRLIYLGRFFQRVESVFVVIWVYIGMVKLALTLYAGAVTMAGTFKLPHYRPLIWPLALIMFVASLLPSDMPTAVLFEAQYLRTFAWLPTVIIPAAVLAADRIRNRGEAA